MRDQLISSGENEALLEDDDGQLENEDFFNDSNDHRKSYLYEQHQDLLKNGPTSSQIIQRRLRSATTGTLPLVCPQIDCKREDQIYLQNDCCTYCRNFDFCAQRAKHLCHPDAFCTNTIDSSATASASGNLNLTSNSSMLKLDSESMFTCHCRSGFSGDGRFCKDIDECSQKHLNDCDSKTTNCVNLAGTYECRCKRGFKPALNYTLQEAIKTSLSENLAASTQTTTSITTILPEDKSKQHRNINSCVDINECSDGMLNKCNPQAKCINTRGSYKCRCKYGYLGNGFECHKWFSSDPNVAAYFHRHSPSSISTKESATAVASEELDNSKDAKGTATMAAQPPPRKINMPLESFSGDPDDDQSDDSWATKAELEDDDGDYKDSYDDDEADDYTGESNKSGRNAPKLTESKWEPLKLVAESPSQLQQVSYFHAARFWMKSSF